MTLKGWARKQPWLVTHVPPPYAQNAWIHDSALVDREQAWHLSDYRVTSVGGGTIWFTKREPRRVEDVPAQ